ncbi:sensor histidine kinase [Pedobacter frigidisoli]|uniref:sensor histidine kinase n=1 Tax=Pedobacter frigidisoli TaxID=2530455 RepID=UPI002930AD49|nr:histidine kinase [Pedobacter frigidisoli]
MSAVVMVYLISFLIWYVTAYHVRPLIKANGGATPEFHIWKFAVPVLWLYIKYAFFAFGYHYASENIKYQKQLRIIVEEKHQAQYAFLRAQINPHFLNNTLNFFYAKSLPLSSELSNGIMTLSEIMHYSLKQDHESQTELIEEEVDHIRNVIKINQLRFNHELQILLEVKGSTTNVRVVPLVLITIVENMLKHGDCTDPANPARITLDVVKEQNCITFKTYNIKKKGPKEQSSGIGINNIGNRLAHHYGTNFSLEITDTATDYAVELTHPILISGKN